MARIKTRLLDDEVWIDDNAPEIYPLAIALINMRTPTTDMTFGQLGVSIEGYLSETSVEKVSLWPPVFMVKDVEGEFIGVKTKQEFADEKREKESGWREVRAFSKFDARTQVAMEQDARKK